MNKNKEILVNKIKKIVDELAIKHSELLKKKELDFNVNGYDIRIGEVFNLESGRTLTIDVKIDECLITEFYFIKGIEIAHSNQTITDLHFDLIKKMKELKEQLQRRGNVKMNSLSGVEIDVEV